jgi:ABC-2 type transport system ATP-binding protein
MLQRLGLAAALDHEPAQLILDEPMSGHDPFGRRDVRDLILEQRDRGATVLFSSHILPDVEMISDRIGILLGGRLNRVATVGELVSGHPHGMEIRCTGVSTHLLPPALEKIVERREHAHETMFILSDVDQTGVFLQWLVAQGIEVRAMTPYRPTLEELFMEAAGSAHFAAGPREATP